MLYIACLFHWSIIILRHYLKAQWCICLILAWVQKFCHSRNQATNHGRTISLFEQNMLKCNLGHWSNTGEWPIPQYSESKKLSSLNGHKNKSLISAATEFLNSCQDWKNAQMCSAIMLINETSVNKWATFTSVMTCHLIFCNFRNLTIWI
jgi:hypothetical protein